MASTERELGAIVAAERVAKRAILLAHAKGGAWAGWTSPRWIFLQVLGVLVIGAIAESQPFAPKTWTTGMLLAALAVSHVMLIGTRIDALVAVVEHDDARGSDGP